MNKTHKYNPGDRVIITPFLSDDCGGATSMNKYCGMVATILDYLEGVPYYYTIDIDDSQHRRYDEYFIDYEKQIYKPGKRFMSYLSHQMITLRPGFPEWKNFVEES